MDILGEKINALWELRGERLEKQKEVDALKSKEDALTQELIQDFGSLNLASCRSLKATASVTKTVVPRLANWDELRRYIRSTGDISVLTRTVATSVLRDYWNNGKEVPGVEKFEITKISLHGVVK